MPDTADTPLLLNPKTRDYAELDPASRRILRATIDFFEDNGKAWLKQQSRDRVWYTDFLDMIKKERVFAHLGTPAAYNEGDEDKHWNTARVTAWNEIAGFYGAQYWYAWGVSTLGLQIIFQSDNEKAKRNAAAELENGGIIGFGLSERTHGADIYSTDCLLSPDGSGGYVANGPKYYIGNGNVARMIPTFGRRTDVEGPDAYVWFIVDSQHPAYKLRGNVIDGQNFVSAYDLENYPISADDILHSGQPAFDAALNAVNVGKFNIGSVGIGIATHSFYETVNHAETKILFGHKVTDFPHVRQILTDSYTRLAAAKLYNERAVDYMRSASAQDRRYLLFDPIAKMKVTRQTERIMDDLLDVISARGFEKDTYFEMGATIIKAMPRLEGTAHVNMALVLKFIPNFLFNQSDSLPVISKRRDAADDTFLFHQGPAKGLSKITFAPWRPVYEEFAQLPNVARFLEQADGLGTLMTTAPPTGEQQTDLDFQLSVGELFTLVPYGQLILEEAKLRSMDTDLIDEIFGVFVRDYSAYAIALHGKTTSTEAQQQWALAQVRKPVRDDERTARIFDQIRGLAGTYEMNP